jgi:protease PrsW
MNEIIVLPPGVSIAILAFLLSLLPAGLFLWIWYLRHHDRSVPASVVTKGLILGTLLVGPAFVLELQAPILWEWLSPGTAHYFDSAVLPIETFGDLFWPAVGTFGIVALIEEGLRFMSLAWWFRKSAFVDQVFDGLVIGLAAGLGFATLENTLYFFQLFWQGNFDTLVFVFFLRFLVSTLAHISFGGIMGVLLAKGYFSVYHRRRYLSQAFLVPWLLHGAYDWLLGVNQTVYAVLMLAVPLAVLITWSNRREFFAVNREGSQNLITQKPPHEYEDVQIRKTKWQAGDVWNRDAQWLRYHSLRKEKK